MSGGPTPTRSVSHRECITREEATELAWVEHAKLHVGREHIWDQLLDKIYSPLLDMSITAVICECGRCKNFGSLHTHTLLAPITRRWPFELLVGDYLSMPMGKGGFTKIGLFVDVFSQRLFGFKLKASAGKNTVDCTAFLKPSGLLTHSWPMEGCTSIAMRLGRSARRWALSYILWPLTRHGSMVCWKGPTIIYCMALHIGVHQDWGRMITRR